MSDHLQPCPSCARHVRASSLACPFCTTALDDAFRSKPARGLPKQRLGRAATFAFGAALAASSACGPSSGGTGTGGGGGGGGIVMPYGAPPNPHPPDPPPDNQQQGGPLLPPPVPPPTPPPTNVVQPYGAPPRPTPESPDLEDPVPPPATTKVRPHHHTQHDPGAPASGYGAAPDPGIQLK